MQFMILGIAPGKPHLDYHHSSLFVQTAQGNFLVDCGDGISKQILRHNYNGDFIDAIFISHYHPDHVSGIFMLIQMLYLEGRKKTLHLFLPERPSAFLDTMHLFYTFEQRLSFTLIVHEVTEIEQFYPNVTIAQTDHLIGYKNLIQKQNYPNMMKSFCFSFNEAGKSLVYTSDLGTFANVRDLFENADTVIIDALHPKADLIISLDQVNIRKIILTHGISKELSIWLNTFLNPRFELARENELIEIQGETVFEKP